MRVRTEREGLLRARRLIAVQALLGVLAGVVVAGLTTFLVVVWGQRQTVIQQLDTLVATRSATSAPPGSWVVALSADGRRTAEGDVPAGYPTEQQRESAAGAGPAGVTAEAYAGGREFLVRTVVDGGWTVAVGVDVQALEGERNRLLAGLAGAALVAGGLAAWLGTRLARQAVGAWDDALSRQERFVADASHELRTPLARVALRARLLDDGLRAGAARATLADDARLLSEEASGMGEVVEDLLHAATLGAHPESGELVDLQQLAHAVVDLDSVRAADRGLRLSAEVAPVPPVRGVEVALRRALDALVDNALRHAAHEVTVRVEVAEPDGVRLTVADDGPGLAPEGLRDLFDPFSRGEDAGRGFGLGLALVRDIADRHRGRVDVEPCEGGGTRFSLWLPVEPPARP